jgi:hypothetical protein
MSEPLPVGPWKSRREVEAIIAPVRCVLTPRWDTRFVVYLGMAVLFPLTALGALACLAWVAQFVGLDRPERNQLQSLAQVLAMAGIPGTGLYLLWRPFRSLGNRLLVGEGGLVEWTPVGGTLVTADDLGVNWVVHIPDAENDDFMYTILLALRHVPSGTRLYVTSFYRNAAQLGQLLEEKLLQHPRRWADLTRWQPASERTPEVDIKQGPEEVQPPRTEGLRQ